MFDAQKLLGQVLREAAGGGLGGGKRRKTGRGGTITGLPRGMEARIGMGVLGLAIAAFEHFRQSAPGPGAAPGAQPASAPPPMPVAGTPGGFPSTPPPPPPGLPATALAPAAGEGEQLRALHLLRTMIAAANADGEIDAKERGSLLGHARESGLGDEDVDALERELRSPVSLEQLLLQTPTGLREEVYVAALLAIDADHPDEHRFLEQLSEGLQLDTETRSRIRQQAGLAP